MTIGLLKSVVLAFSVIGMAAPAMAQVRSVDPNSALGSSTVVGDAALTNPTPKASGVDPQIPTDNVGSTSANDAAQSDIAVPQDDAAMTESATQTDNSVASAAPAVAGGTYRKDDVIGAAEGVFGKGAEGLAGIVEKILKDQGEPNAYIAGREASGAFVVGVRYGSGTMTHTVEGNRPVYWTGPSLGFDVGGDATKVFVLVYNLYDSQDLYRRYPQAEGRAYFVGGFSATYLRRGSIVMIPIRLGVGVRLGANIGYMKFSEKSRWLPF